MAEYELHSRKRTYGFWSKENVTVHSGVSEIDYVFDNKTLYHQSTGTVGLSFIESLQYHGEGRSSAGPVASICFTESQLVEFIIEAEKALRSIQSK